MLHAGLDLSRKKLDVCLLSDQGEHLDQLAVPPDVDSLRTLARRIEEVHREPVCAVVESMTGARIVHDTLEACGLVGRDRRRPEGQGPRAACLQDRQDRLDGAGDALASATWCRRSGCPIPRVREERELARFRLHLVKHKSALKNRIHSTLINFGRPCPVTDLFGVEGRRAARAPRGPRALARATSPPRVALIDDLERQIDEVNRRLARATPTTPTSRCF